MSQMGQLSLLGEDYTSQPWRTNELIVSASKSQVEILRAISKLYLGGRPFEVDPTFSKGVFYKDFPEPVHKFDIAPQRPDVRQANCCDLPLEDDSVESICIDLPFVLKDTTRENMVAGKIEGRFSGFRNAAALYEAYCGALREAYRVLRPKGICAFKCQDQVSGGKQHWVHYESMRMALEIGFVIEDIFVLLATSVLISPNMARQQHSRKNLSYFLVLRKV